MFPVFGVIFGTKENEFTSTVMFANVGMRLTCASAEMCEAMLISCKVKTLPLYS